jgi:hypothetical protein
LVAKKYQELDLGRFHPTHNRTQKVALLEDGFLNVQNRAVDQKDQNGKVIKKIERLQEFRESKLMFPVIARLKRRTANDPYVQSLTGPRRNLILKRIIRIKRERSEPRITEIDLCKLAEPSLDIR